MNGSHDLHHLQVDQGGGDHAGDGEGGDGVQLKKGPWTAAEDSVLTEYVRKHGEGNWNAVQRSTGLARCGKSCRLRWANHLRPNLKKGAFSPEEERLIVELHAQLGNKWARMAAQLPGRTDNEIKNYWNTRVKRRHRQGLPLYPQEIQTQQHGGNNHHHHPYHHQQQQQQQQLLQQQQTPQSSHSHHSHHHQSPASTPTTPTSSFTFSTTPTAAHRHHHYFSRSPTPNCLSPTPPPLSPSSALHSPHYHHHQTLPTLSLFDSTTTTTTTTTTNPTSFNVIHRSPPILQTPLRFKRFHADTTNSSGGATTTNSPCSTTTAANNFNTNYNNDHNNNNFNTNTYQNGNYSLPYSTFLRSPTSVSTPPQQQPNCNAFSNTSSSTMLMSLHQQPPFSTNQNMVPFVSNNSSTSNILRTQFEKDYNSSSTNNNFPNNSVFAMKPELPSSQFYSHHHNGSSTELAFIDNNNDQKLSLSGGGGSGLLEDLLDETTAHMSNSMEDKRDFTGFNNHWSDSNSLNLSPGTLKPKEETAAEAAAAVDQNNNNNNNTTMHEDLSKIFNSINNPSMQLPAEWYNDAGTGSGEEASNGQSSVVTTDDNNMISLDQMHQIASMFRVDDSSSEEQDHHHLNLPGIC